MTDHQDLLDQLAVLKADNARLRRLLDMQGAPDSLRHAFRDTVAMLRAIMRRTAETAVDVESYDAHLVGRLDAIVRVRARTDAFGEAELHSIISDELSFHLVQEGERATLDGPGIQLLPKPAGTLALAVHELAVNAVEHGPLGGTAGHVEVVWWIEPAEAGPVLALSWKETGATEAVVQRRRGFGTTMLEEMLAYDLQARTALSYEPDGLRCSIQLPFTASVGRLIEKDAALEQ